MFGDRLIETRSHADIEDCNACQNYSSGLMCCVTPASARVHGLQCASECTLAYVRARVLSIRCAMRMCGTVDFV